MAALNRNDIVAAIDALFKADTAILYGSGKLLEHISVRYLEFEKAKLTVGQGYKMYLKGNLREKVAARMQCSDYIVTVESRIEGITVDPETAQQHIDDIDERIDYLIDNQMWTGVNLTPYFSNSESTVINLEWISSSCEPELINDQWRVHSEGIMTVEVNRLRQ